MQYACQLRPDMSYKGWLGFGLFVVVWFFLPRYEQTLNVET